MFKITKTMLTEEEIKARVAELGKQIEKEKNKKLSFKDNKRLK